MVENKNDKGDVISWTVTMHERERHLLRTTTFREVHVTVGGPYVVGHSRVRPESDRNEIWPLIWEKAYAQYLGGYNRIGHGGDPTAAMSLLTGREASYVSFAPPNRWFRSYGASEMQANLANGKIVVLLSKAGIASQTGSDPSTARHPDLGAYGLLAAHAYFVRAVEQLDGKPFVRLGNPWGAVEPEPVPFDRLATVFSGVAIGALP